MITHANFAGTPFADFIHCPRCGAGRLSRHDARAIRCLGCGFILYFNCATAAAAFILYRDRLVLGIRGKEPQLGMLDLPGGFVEFDETVENALAREVREELNLKISPPVYLTSAPNDYRYAGVLYKTMDLFFVCEVDDISQIKPMDDVSAYRLLKPHDIDPQELAFASVRVALQRFLERLGPASVG